jgi:hypothetical protein
VRLWLLRASAVRGEPLDVEGKRYGAYSLLARRTDCSVWMSALALAPGYWNLIPVRLFAALLTKNLVCLYRGFPRCPQDSELRLGA